MPLEVTMTWEQEFDLAITPKTPGGDDAPIDGVPQWTLTGTSCTLVPINDLARTVKGVSDASGDVTVTVTVDADMGTGIVHVIDTCLVHVQTPMATNLGMTASPPRLQTPAPPTP